MKGLAAGPQFILFSALTLTCVGLGTIVAMGVGTTVFAIPLEELPGVLANPEADHAHALIWMNNITQIIGFGFPVIAYLLLFGTGNVHNLMLKKPGIVLFVAPILILSATPAEKRLSPEKRLVISRLQRNASTCFFSATLIW